ncbi:MAG TPA: hypothetical protein VMD30_11020 [Tepidisphaeraceae bacterium]|nr:hypothetical protein [Tepidisphaeraceae bacterium]
MQPFIVHRLEMGCVSDDTPDPYGKAGFSSISAYVFASDKLAFDEIRSAAGTRKIVAVRCGGLEVRGQVFEGTLEKNDAQGRVQIAVSTVISHNALIADGAA